MSPPLVLVDPPRSPFWPLAATRPVADLLAGARSFRARWAAREGAVEALWCDTEVAGCAFRSGDAPPLNRWPAQGGGLRIALASWTPPAEWRFAGRGRWTHEGGPVAWQLDAADARTLAGASTPGRILEALAGLDLPTAEAGGLLPGSIWELIDLNPALLREDAATFVASAEVPLVDFVVLLGDRLAAGPDVAIGPFAVLDARAGPILLDRGARVEPHALCRGPLYVGPDSVVLGGAVGNGTSIGPGCRIRGEVEQSIFQGWVNKAHDGFVGHSAVGEWVNLGAGTTTSDLKNTYGPVRVREGEERTDTGLLKLGAMLGDHVKTGIGSLLTTGARVGVGSHLLGGGVVPDHVPSFTWRDRAARERVRLDALLHTAEAVMARRGMRLTEGERAILTALHGSSD